MAVNDAKINNAMPMLKPFIALRLPAAEIKILLEINLNVTIDGEYLEQLTSASNTQSRIDLRIFTKVQW